MWSRIRPVFARVRELFSRGAIDAERDEEFRFHLEMQAAHNLRMGMAPGQARRAALVAFGGTQRFREATGEARGVAVLENLARDIRFALRRLRRAPGFAVGAILTLGIGVGTAAGIGAIVYGVLLRELPYPEPERLVRVSLETPGLAVRGDMHSDATFGYLAERSRSLAGMGAYYTNDGINVTDGDEPERVTGAMISPSTFGVLGARAIVGRTFVPADTLAVNSNGVLISQDLWERRYGGSPDIVGREIELNRGRRRVVGVLPRDFRFPGPEVAVWYPLRTSFDDPSITSRHLDVVARLRPGVTVAQAEAELNALLARIPARFPSIGAEQLRRSAARIALPSLHAATVGPVRAQLVLLGALVCIVLLVATANVVTLFLLRAERAAQEIAVALSLGAGRARLAQRFVVEGAVIGAASLLVGIPVAALAVTTKLGFTVREIPRLDEVSLDTRVLAVLAVTAIAVGILVGLTALARTGLRGLAERLRGSARATGSPAWQRTQRGLAALQVAIALALVVAAGLLGRSFWNLKNAQLGFAPGDAYTFELSLPYNGYATYEQSAAFHARAMSEIRALPGVTGVEGALRLPLTPAATPGLALRIESADERSEVVSSAANLATGGYFRLMGIPLLHGRAFERGDLLGTPKVLVSASLARALFGTSDAVGRTIRQAARPGHAIRSFDIVGVVGDVHADRIENGLTPAVYFPLQRDADGLARDSFPIPYVPRWVTYVVRGSPLPEPATLRGIVRSLDQRVPPVNMQPLHAVVDRATARVRLTLLLIGFAGAATLLLGVVGVYSVVAYAAGGRAREFGVRIALGAAPGAVARLVLRDGAAVAGAGVLAGTAFALAGTRFIRSLLYEVSPTSPVEFGIAAVALLIIGVSAAVLPARRASRTDPATVLRSD